MSTNGETGEGVGGPITPAQVLHALNCLGAVAVADPDTRPTGPTAEDLPELLGVLLAKVELEVAARVHPGADPPAGVPQLMVGWDGMLGEEVLALAVLANRLQRSALDLTRAESEDAPEPSATSAAASAVLAAANLVDAFLLSDEPEQARRSLDDAEGFLADALGALHDARGELSDR